MASRSHAVSSVAILALFFIATFHAFTTTMAYNAKRVVDVRANEEEVAKTLADYVANLSNKISKERKKFTVVVAGSVLIDTMRYMTQEPYLHSIDWSAWHMFWVDERLVPLTDAESNYKKCYDVFLSKVPIPTSNIHIANVTLPLDAAADDYEARIKDLVKRGIIDFSETSGFPQFDLMLLGIGTDGHVASLFPGYPQLKEKHRWVASVKDAPSTPPHRITFTFPVINSAKNFAFVVTSLDYFPEIIKNQFAEKVQIGVKGGNGMDLLPVQMVSPQGQLTWFLDKITAAKL